eukprot:m.23348 g.23348  ORF g.23348 m.23348 type:complete len:355 (-) comp4094_c0_seq1:8-1072(-)
MPPAPMAASAPAAVCAETSDETPDWPAKRRRLTAVSAPPSPTFGEPAEGASVSQLPASASSSDEQDEPLIASARPPLRRNLSREFTPAATRPRKQLGTLIRRRSVAPLPRQPLQGPPPPGQSPEELAEVFSTFRDDIKQRARVVGRCASGIALPETQAADRITLVLDLDETLVHCAVVQPPQFDFSFEVRLSSQSEPVTVYGRVRPHAVAFLQRACELFEVVLFTASLRVYAEKVVALIDPDGQIHHHLFREHCIRIGDNFVKDLSILGRDLERTILVDNSPQAFVYQLENGFPISSWFDNEDDTELLRLLEDFLEPLASKAPDDVRPELHAFSPFHRILLSGEELDATQPSAS